MSRTRAVALACAAGSYLLPATAHADAIDLWLVFSRVGNWRESPLKTIALLVLVLSVNYGLNLAVLGLPANRLGVGLKRSAKDLIGFTVLAQVADRVGIVVGFAVATACAIVFKCEGEGGLAAWFLAGAALNFMFCGITVGLLAYYYLKQRWSLPAASSRWLALAAGVITNPSWTMVMWLGRGH